MLPVGLRLTQSLVFGLSIQSRAELLLFVTPLAVVLVALCVIWMELRAQGLFILLMIVTIWGPQLVFIFFFRCCERE